MQYCSLWHQTLLSPPDISTTGCYFCFGPTSSFFLGISPLFPSSILNTFQHGRLIFQCRIFAFSYCLWGLSQQEYWSDLPFPPPVDHILSELFTMTCLSWVALHGMAHSFIELYKSLLHDKAVIHEGDTIGKRVQKLWLLKP